MTEAETIEALTNIADVGATYSSLWLSLTFAYLTVAYLVGRSLSRFQCVVISVLYAVSATLYGIVAIGYWDSWWKVQADGARTALDKVWLFSEWPYYIETASLFVCSGTLVSLYFMYKVRRDGADRAE